MISSKKANIEDIPKLIEIEKTVSGSRLYSCMDNFEDWQEEIKKSEVFIIELDNKTVGNISLTTTDENSLYISGLVVTPEYQGKGLAKKAMMWVLDNNRWAKEYTLVTHPENMSALNLYKSLGFVVQSRIENYWDEGEPRLLLALHR